MATALPCPGPAAWRAPYPNAIINTVNQGIMLSVVLARLIKTVIFSLSCSCHNVILVKNELCGAEACWTGWELLGERKGFWALTTTEPQINGRRISEQINNLAIFLPEFQNNLLGTDLTVIVSFPLILFNCVFNFIRLPVLIGNRIFLQKNTAVKSAIINRQPDFF